MTETPDSQPDTIVEGVVPGYPLVTIEQRASIDVDVTSAKRWENPDGSVFAFVTWEEWPGDGSGWEFTT
jgi:hypothetical protein